MASCNSVICCLLSNQCRSLCFRKCAGRCCLRCSVKASRACAGVASCMKENESSICLSKRRSVQMARTKRWTWPLLVLGLLSSPQLTSSQQDNRLAADVSASASSLRLKALGLTESQIDEITKLWVTENAVRDKPLERAPSSLRGLQEAETDAEGPEEGEEAHCEKEGFAKFKKSRDWLNLLGVVVCICCAATAAGLTLGMLSLDALELQLKARAGTPEEKAYSKKLLPLIKQHHLLLVSLLLFNACANETLPLFLDHLMPPIVAIAISVTLVLFFGEIFPSAIFTGPRQLEYAAAMAKPAWVIIAFFFPVSYPISIVLDGVLGHEGLRKYTRKELAALMDVQQDLHEEDAALSLSIAGPMAYRRGPSMSSPVAIADTGLGGNRSPRSGGTRLSPSVHAHDAALTEHEANMVSAILENSHQTVETSDVMVGVDDMFAMSTNDVIGLEQREELVSLGFSRVPVYEGTSKSNIRGFFQVKGLIVTDASTPLRVSELPLVKPLIIGPHCPLNLLMQEFRGGASHLAIVTHDPDGTAKLLADEQPLEGSMAVIGITTMEDVIEELLQQEILDENDRMRRQAHLKALTLLKGVRGSRFGGELITERGAMGQLADMQDRVAKSEELTEIISQLEHQGDDNEDDDTGEESQVNFMTKKLLQDIVSSSAQPPPLKPRSAHSLIARASTPSSSSTNLARMGGEMGHTAPRDAKTTNKPSPRN